MNCPITLGHIYDQGPCLSGWMKLLRSLGCDVEGAESIAETRGSFNREMILSLGDIAVSNDAADALWCVRALDWRDESVHRYVIDHVVLPAVARASAYADANYSPAFSAANAAEATKVAARDAADAAGDAARNAERSRQRDDIVASFPPIVLRGNYIATGQCTLKSEIAKGASDERRT